MKMGKKLNYRKLTLLHYFVNCKNGNAIVNEQIGNKINILETVNKIG
jgi:hypothetical protein